MITITNIWHSTPISTFDALSKWHEPDIDYNNSALFSIPIFFLKVICDRDNELAESSEAIRSLHNERESLKRQLEDLQSTLEYQEAKMDRAGMKFWNSNLNSY